MSQLLLEEIRTTTRFVVDHSCRVKVSHAALFAFCRNIETFACFHWWDSCPVDLSWMSLEQRLNFLVMINAISFSYWRSPKWEVLVDGLQLDGTWALIACLAKAVRNRAIDCSFEYLSRIDQDTLAGVTRGTVELPFLQERGDILRSIGSLVVDRFDGNFLRVVDDAKGDVSKFLSTLVSLFPSFSDESSYETRRVVFLKRGQLLAGDVSVLLSRTPDAKRVWSVDKLTACADYKLPQVLRRHGILVYDGELTRQIDSGLPINPGSKEEVEIRANTIWAVEWIGDELRKRFPCITSHHVNDYLWLSGQRRDSRDRPYHLARTTAY